MEFEELGLNEANTARLRKSLEQADRGEFIDHETIKAKYAVWLDPSDEANS